MKLEHERTEKIYSITIEELKKIFNIPAEEDVKKISIERDILTGKHDCELVTSKISLH